MSSALHAVLTALLWLSMALWPALAAATVPSDGEAHVVPCEPPAPDPGLVLSLSLEASSESVEDEPETSSQRGDTALRARSHHDLLAPPGLRVTPRRGHATRFDAIPLAGAGCIRGPPNT